MVVPLKVFSFQERLDDQNLNWGSKNGTWSRWIKCWMTRFASLWNAYYYKNIDENYLIGFYWVRIGLDQNYCQWRRKCFLLVRLLLSIALASSLGLLSSVSKPNKCASKSSEELYREACSSHHQFLLFGFPSVLCNEPQNANMYQNCRKYCRVWSLPWVLGTPHYMSVHITTYNASRSCSDLEEGCYVSIVGFLILPSQNIKSSHCWKKKTKNTTRFFRPISSITWVGRLSTIFRQLFVTRSGKKWKEVAKENAPCLTVWFQISTVNNSF